MGVLLPDSFAHACALVAEESDRVPLAGGTDLLVAWPQRFDRHGTSYVDLSRLAELRTLSWTDGNLVLGGATTYWDVLGAPGVREAFPLLVDAARQVGALQIQTRGTWAGNVISASPSADGAAVLMAHDAVLELASAGGREEVALADFYLPDGRPRRRPDQLVRAIRIPRRKYALHAFEKVGARAAQTPSKLNLALARSSAGWRAVAGGMAPRVTRWRSLERLLESETRVASPDDLLPALRADLSPRSDLRASASYRERVLARVAFAKLAEFCPWVEGSLGGRSV